MFLSGGVDPRVGMVNMVSRAGSKHTSVMRLEFQGTKRESTLVPAHHDLSYTAAFFAHADRKILIHSKDRFGWKKL